MIIRTTGTKSRVLHIPAGLTILEFNTSAPNKFNVTVFSEQVSRLVISILVLMRQQEFFLADELSIYKQLRTTSKKLELIAVTSVMVDAISGM